MPVGMDVGSARRMPQHVLHIVADRLQRSNLRARDADLDRGLHAVSLLALFHHHGCFRSNILERVPQFFDQVRRLFHVVRVHQDLSVVRSGYLGIDVVVKAREARPEIAGIFLYQGLVRKNRLDSACSRVGGLDPGPLGQPNVDDELLSLSHGKQVLRHDRQKSKPGQKGQHGADENGLLVHHRQGDDHVIALLHVIEEGQFFRLVRTPVALSLQPGPNEPLRHHRSQEHRHQVGDGQRQRHGDRQGPDKLARCT